MFKPVKSALILSGLLLSTQPVLANDFYIGAKAGKMMSDANGFADTNNLGVVLGYDIIGVVLGDVSVEGELTNSTGTASAPPPANDWEIQTAAAYAVFRSAGMVYFKGKAGVLHEKVKTQERTVNDTGTSIGAGVGLSVGVAQFELEYTLIEQDVNYLSLTVNF